MPAALGDGWRGADTYGNDLDYEGGKYSRGATHGQTANQILLGGGLPRPYPSEAVAGGGRDVGFERRVHSTLYRNQGPLVSQDDSSFHSYGYEPKARDARGHRVDYNEDELSFASSSGRVSPFMGAGPKPRSNTLDNAHDPGAAARKASLEAGLDLHE